MKYEFHWLSDIADAKKTPAEDAIRDGQESGDSPITFCHEGTVLVTLSSSDALQRRYEGDMRCCCGIVRGAIRGKCNGSSVMFEAVSG
jgi:hypothetical protein